MARTHPVDRRADRPSARPAARRGRARTAEEREWLRTALHDGLGQILTSISFLASSLSRKLAVRRLPEAMEAEELLSLAGRAIVETQALARDPEEVRRNGTRS